MDIMMDRSDFQEVKLEPKRLIEEEKAARKAARAERRAEQQRAAQSEQLDVIWEVDGIASYIGRTRNQTNHMLASGYLPARKVGGIWVASRRKLDAFFQEVAA